MTCIPTRTVAFQRFLTFVVALLLAACGGGGKGDTRTSPVVAVPLGVVPGGFQQRKPLPNVVIGGRRITATCSGAPGTSPEYSFWARRGTVNKLAVYFDGGGACWDDATCSFPIADGLPRGVPQLYKTSIDATDNIGNGAAGILDLNNADNPIKDWSIVYVPYCTADIHGGSKTATYTTVTTGTTGAPGTPFTIEHRGADNFAVILQWMADNFKRPEEVLVSGSSAGAYGAIIHYPKVRSTFQSAKGVLLADAGQGITSPAFDANRGAAWNLTLDSAVWGSNPDGTPTSTLMRTLMQTYPNDRMAQYTTATDPAQTLFHSVMTYGLTPDRHPEVCRSWTDQMLSGLSMNRTLPNFSSYLAAGYTHTILRGQIATPTGPGNDPYTEASAGVPFMRWMKAQLNGEPASNLACTDCVEWQMPCTF